MDFIRVRVCGYLRRSRCVRPSVCGPRGLMHVPVPSHFWAACLDVACTPCLVSCRCAVSSSLSSCHLSCLVIVMPAVVLPFTFRALDLSLSSLSLVRAVHLPLCVSFPHVLSFCHLSLLVSLPSPGHERIETYPLQLKRGRKSKGK